MKISEYHLVDEYWGDLFIRCTHYEKNTWAVYQEGHSAPCLHKEHLAFLYEPPPSARGDKYFKQARFSSPEEAFKFYTDNKEKIQSGHWQHPSNKEKK